METALPREDVERSIRLLLAKDTLPWELQRDGETKQYDLRPQIDDLWVSSAGEGEVVLSMRLQTDSGGSGRPEQVLLVEQDGLRFLGRCLSTFQLKR